MLVSPLLDHECWFKDDSEHRTWLLVSAQYIFLIVWMNEWGTNISSAFSCYLVNSVTIQKERERGKLKTFLCNSQAQVQAKKKKQLIKVFRNSIWDGNRREFSDVVTNCLMTRKNSKIEGSNSTHCLLKTSEKLPNSWESHGSSL